MAYQPTLNDLDDMESSFNQTNSSKPYQPALSDLPSDKPSLGRIPLIFGIDVNDDAPKESLGSQLSKDAIGLGRGFTEAGQGAKQLYLGLLERLGKVPAGTVAQYTKQKDAEKKQYDETMPSAKNEYSNMLRTGARNPIMAAASAFLPESMIARMLYGAGTVGANEAASYVPAGEDRSANVIKGMAAGAIIPAIAESPNLLKSVATTVFDSAKSMLPQTSLKKAIDEATQKHLADQQAFKDAQQFSKEETGKSDVQAMNYAKINEQKNLQDQSVPNLLTNPEESQANLDQAISNHENSQQSLDNVNNQIDKHLNKNAAHDVRAAAKIKKIRENERKEISEKYDEIGESLNDKNIVISNPKEAKDILEEIKDLARQGKLNTPEAESLAKELENVGKNEVIPANDYLTALRSVKDYAREARKEAYTHGINAEDKAALIQRHDELDKKADEMGKILENGIGTEDSEALSKANKDWREKVIPLYKNPIYQKIYFKGQMPSNIVNELRGTDPGNILLRETIKNDPETLKNVVGQRYKYSKGMEVHEPNENMQEYINQMPELQNLLRQRQVATENFENSAVNRKMAEENHKSNVKNYDESQRVNQKRTETQNKIRLLDKNIENLSKKAAKKDISLAEKIKLENEMSKSRKARSNLLKSVGGVGATATALYGINKVSDMFDNNGDE